MDWRKIWRKTYRTMCQTAVGVIPTAGVFWSWDWKPMVSTILVSGLVCFLSALADYDNVDLSSIEDENPADDEVIEH